MKEYLELLKLLKVGNQSVQILHRHLVGENWFGDHEQLGSYYEQLQQENKELKERIDKAIEYINKEENMKIFNGAFGYGEFIGTLEEILEGDK